MRPIVRFAKKGAKFELPVHVGTGELTANRAHRCERQVLAFLRYSGRCVPDLELVEVEAREKSVHQTIARLVSISGTKRAILT